MKEISDELYRRLEYLGIIDNNVRSHNVGKSNYYKKLIQPWTVWLDYSELTAWDYDIIKRVLRIKDEEGMSENEARKMDYEKIIHNCQERIRQIDIEENVIGNDSNENAKICFPYLCVKTMIDDDGDRMVEKFTKDLWYYAISDGVIMDNLGNHVTLTSEQVNEYFKRNQKINNYEYNN